jgi:hypothetical protein
MKNEEANNDFFFEEIQKYEGVIFHIYFFIRKFTNNNKK